MSFGNAGGLNLGKTGLLISMTPVLFRFQQAPLLKCLSIIFSNYIIFCGGWAFLSLVNSKI